MNIQLTLFLLLVKIFRMSLLPPPPTHFNKNDAACLDCHLAIECVQFKIFTFDVIVP